MHQYDHPTAVPVQPDPGAPGTPGFMRDGDPGAGTPPSIWSSKLANSMMMELINAVQGGGQTLDQDNDAQLLAAITAIATSAAGAAAGFVGEIRTKAGPTVPSGWLECNGAAVSRTTYAGLFAEIGVLWGPGNGTTTFNIPDQDDAFFRGIRSGRAIGEFEASSFPAHTHGAGFIDTEGRSDAGSSMIVPTNTGGLSGFSTASAGGAENRPDSYGVMFIIKT
jgi:microcystin-dependent protein